MEYKKKCNVCGHIWCYTDSDLSEDKLNKFNSAVHAIGGIASAFGGNIFQQGFLANQMENDKRKMVNRNQCPKCNSINCKDISNEEFETHISNQDSTKAQITINSNASTETLLKRAELFLEDNEWGNAVAYCDNVLDTEPENTKAYLLKLMAELQVNKKEELKNQKESFENNKTYKKILRFADDTLKNELCAYNDFISERNRIAFCEDYYARALKIMSFADTEHAFLSAIEFLDKIIEYKDSKEKKEVCLEKIKALKQQAKEEAVQKSKTIKKALIVSIVAIVAIISIMVPYVNSQNKIIAISAGGEHTIGIKKSGAVVHVGDYLQDEEELKNWTGIVKVSVAEGHVVGLKNDGSVVAVGGNYAGKSAVKGWKDIVAVSTGDRHTIGIKNDGTIIATGDNKYGQCDTDEWENIICTSANYSITVGLKKDGTVIATEKVGGSQNDVAGWNDIVAVSAGFGHIIGLKKDGTVVAAGNNQYEKCDVGDWKDIIAISAGEWHTVALRRDGKVVAVGKNDSGQCDVQEWKDIVAISAGDDHTVGLKKDGTVVAVGKHSKGQCDVDQW